MALNIRDHATLTSAAERLDELIHACRPRSWVYAIDPVLTADVTRKAKTLRTCLQKLREAVADPNHKPVREDEKLTKEAIATRLYRNPLLQEIARLINYGGKCPEQIRARVGELNERYGNHDVSMAFLDMTRHDEKSGLRVLNPEARKACWQLLGPPPEHPGYARYYEINNRQPPAEHQPPGPEPEEPQQEPPNPKRKGRGR